MKALIRRFLQVLVSGGGGAPEFIAGGLYLLGEVGVVIFFFPCFRVLLWFSSLLSIVSMSLLSLSSLFSRLLQIYRMLTFFFFIQLFSSVPGLRSMINDPPKPASSTQEGSSYDPRKREPQFAHASALPLWELVRTIQSYIYAHQKAYLLHSNRRLSSHTTTPLYLCTPVNSSQASHSQRRLTSHRTPSRISSSGSCIRTLKSPRCRLRVSMAMRTRNR